jgi:polyisoprenoid-binding protein YceI
MSGTSPRRFRRVRTFTISSLSLGLTLFSSVVCLPQSPTVAKAASETVLTLDPARTKVHWTLDTTLHTVHGTFALKSGTIHFDPETGKAGGEIVVLATSGESGNGSRDSRMHKEILETAKYPEVAFRPAQVEGKVAPSGASDVKLNGTFSIHGADHAITASVHADLTGSQWTGTAKFDVPYVSYGIKDPSNFLLKVKPVVEVELEMSGQVTTAR